MPVKKTNDHLANERTFLAWMRTAIGIMGFGFVVVKFSMFVRQISLMLGRETAIQQKGHSAITGIVLVAIGALTSLLAFINYKKVKRQIETDSYSGSASLIPVVTCCIIFISALLIWYLIESIQ
ncbi:YidH family protein [Niabella insulamsoli]|uniref:YidH family protein n=1 Tax=Niabella insulamsoli TaxID=3144874 RepID=UPI0031FC6099